MNTEKSSRIKAGTGDWEGVAHKEGRELGKRYPGCLERKKITREKKKKRMASSVKYCRVAKSYRHREVILGATGREMG